MNTKERLTAICQLLEQGNRTGPEIGAHFQFGASYARNICKLGEHYELIERAGVKTGRGGSAFLYRVRDDWKDRIQDIPYRKPHTLRTQRRQARAALARCSFVFNLGVMA
jgi:hypothetical protein